jgi:hypothetical protein
MLLTVGVGTGKGDLTIAGALKWKHIAWYGAIGPWRD